jgi:hypothetical protein
LNLPHCLRANHSYRLQTAHAAVRGLMMTTRELTFPVLDAAEVPSTMLLATVQWERIALKWRALAEQRRDHHVDLYKSGRWKHYYTEEQFLTEMRKAVALAERWVKIAPSPDERAPPEIEQPAAA